MSNVIPIVSSSPPPLEDTGGFDDWGDEDDDFGGFMGADTTQNESNHWDRADIKQIQLKNSHTLPNNSVEMDHVNANFTNSLRSTCSDLDKIENCKPQSILFSLDLDKSSNISETVLDNIETVNNKESKTSDNFSGNSTGDSGLFDESPVPVSEDTKSDSSDESPEAFQDISGDIPVHKTTEMGNSQTDKTENIKEEIDSGKVMVTDVLSSQSLQHQEDGDDRQLSEKNYDSHNQDIVINEKSESEGSANFESDGSKILFGSSPVVTGENNSSLEGKPCNDELSPSVETDSNQVSVTESVSVEDSNSHSLVLSAGSGTDLTDGGQEEVIQKEPEQSEINVSTENISNGVCDNILPVDDEYTDFNAVNVNEKFDNFSDQVTNGKNTESANISLELTDSEEFRCIQDLSEKDENVSQEPEVELEKFADFSAALDTENDKGFANINTFTKNEEENKNEFENIERTKLETNCTEFASFSANDHGDSCNFADFSSPTDGENNSEISKTENESISTSAETKQDEPENGSSVKSDNDFDEFADFTSADAEKIANFTPSEQDEFGNFSSDEKLDDEDDFADFSSVPVTNEFADFRSTETEIESSSFKGDVDSGWASFQHTDIPVSKSPKQTNQEPIGSKLCTCFEDSGQMFQETTDLVVSVDENKNKLWEKIQKVDNTKLLKWQQFYSSKNLFISLKIDTKNILLGHKKPSVPIYAANLTLLEPTKGSPPLLQPEVTLVDTNKQEDIKDLPPVQFDWTSSGLTNPLEVNNKLQHLDFLTVDESELIAKPKVFDSELIHGQRPKMQPLQDILANLKETKKTRLEDLSNEAGRVISHLPDFSFMKAKVLMFPVKQNNL